MKLLSHISLGTFAATVIGIKVHLLGNNLLFMKIHAYFVSLNLTNFFFFEINEKNHE